MTDFAGRPTEGGAVSRTENGFSVDAFFAPRAKKGSRENTFRLKKIKEKGAAAEAVAA